MKKLILSLLVFFPTLAFSDAEKDVRTVDFVDLSRYVGVWYEVASIPQSFQKQCTGNTTAEYSFAEDNLIKVVNSCDTKENKRSIAEGRARVEDRETNAKLRVTFVKIIDWVFTFGGDYWVLDLDPDYTYAVVGEGSREYAWILSRTPNISAEKLAAAIHNLTEQGYDTCKILTSVQEGGFRDRKRLCDLEK